jgi:hypothetical protein
MPMSGAEVAREAHGGGPALKLVSLIIRNDFAGATRLNEAIAEEMPFNWVVQRWFVGRIEKQWPQAKANEPWEQERAAADPALEAISKEALAQWAGDRAALAGKDRLADLGRRLEAVKPKQATQPEAAPAVITKPAVSPVLPDFDKMPEPPKAPADATPLERLTYPPGLLGHAVDHAFRCTDLPDRQLALWGALTGMAKILDRRVIGPTGSSTVLYNLLLAASGAGKEPAQQFALLLLRSAGKGYESLFQGGSLASVQAVEDLVRNTPNCLVVIDEFGRWFRMIQDQSGNVSELPGVLCKLWGQKPDGRYGLMRRANRTGKDEEVQIQWPTLALAGASVSEPFWDACGDEHISGGFLNRCLILDAGLGAMELVETTRDPEKLDDWMLQLMRKVTGGVAPEQGSMPIMTKDWIGPFRMAWDARAKEAYLDHVSATRKLPEGRKRDLSIRTPEIATRLATVCARWCGARNVELPHYEWGWAWAEHSRDMVLAGANERMKVERDFDAVCRHFKTLLADGPMKWMDIRLKSRSAAGAFGMELLDKAMNEMLETGEIREIDLKEQKARGLRGNAGAPGRWFELGGNGGRAN